MSQQINLCTADFRPVKQRFGAKTMLLLLLGSLVLSSSLMGAWVWQVGQANQTIAQTISQQTQEVESLKVAIAQAQAAAAPADTSLVNQLIERRAEVGKRQTLIDAIREGVFKPGEQHSDRLLLLSRSIPANVWVSEVKVEQGRFEVTGYTLNPDALNTWVHALSASSLMRHLKLTNISVENKSEAGAKLRGISSDPLANASATVTAPLWGFHLVNLEPPVLAPLAAASGAKP
jgi:Tfp pilus assembly protein PilN